MGNFNINNRTSTDVLSLFIFKEIDHTVDFKTRVLEKDGVPVTEATFSLVSSLDVDVNLGCWMTLKKGNRELTAKSFYLSLSKIILPLSSPIHILALCFIVIGSLL